MTEGNTNGCAMPLDAVKRRIPTLQLIDDSGMRDKTAQITTRAPDYFWMVPASTSGYHHPLCREERGLWIHTLMLSTVIERLSDSWVEQGLINEHEVDLAHSAAILHDQRKNGLKTDISESSVSDHDVLMAQIVLSTSLDERIASAIASHMGPWYDGPEPKKPLEQLVHTADMICSTGTITPAVHGPLPHELEGRGIREVDLS